MFACSNNDKGARGVLSYYKESVNKALAALFPEVDWENNQSKLLLILCHVYIYH